LATSSATGAPVASSTSDLPNTRLVAPRSAGAKRDAAKYPKKLAFPFKINSLQSFSTAGTGLAIVVGLFLICAWLLRRGGPKANGQAVALISGALLAGEKQ
jgi:hypothetical protein